MRISEFINKLLPADKARLLLLQLSEMCPMYNWCTLIVTPELLEFSKHRIMNQNYVHGCHFGFGSNPQQAFLTFYLGDYPMQLCYELLIRQGSTMVRLVVPYTDAFNLRFRERYANMLTIETVRKYREFRTVLYIE